MCRNFVLYYFCSSQLHVDSSHQINWYGTEKGEVPIMENKLFRIKLLLRNCSASRRELIFDDMNLMSLIIGIVTFVRTGEGFL